MEIRLIIMSDDRLDNESVIFTDDLSAKAEEWCVPGQIVRYDRIIESDLPGEFPINSLLRRR